MTDMTVSRLKYVHRDRSRHGQVRIYFRRGRGTPKIRLTEPEGSPAFFARIAELIRETELGPIETKTKPPSLVAEAGTLGHLTQTYMASPAFEDYDAATVRKRRHLFKTMLQEPIAPESDKIFRNFPMARLTIDDLEALRDRAKKAGTIGQANERVKAWRALFKWACAQRPPLATMNVAAAISLIRVPTEGWHTWSLDEIEQFERRHPPGTRAHLAMMILLYTGARRSDVVRLGRPHARGGTLRWNVYKGRRRHPTVVEIDILPPLADALSRCHLGDVTWLVTEYGHPFSKDGFGNWFKDRCVEAGLPHCSAHGLRKAGATRAAENGATPHMLMAMYGWKTLQQAERYTRAAERKRLAKAGMPMLMRSKVGNSTA